MLLKFLQRIVVLIRKAAILFEALTKEVWAFITGQPMTKKR